MQDTVPPDADGVRRSTALVLLLDMLGSLALGVWALLGLHGTPGPGPVSSWGPLVMGAYAALALLANAGCFARNGNANIWRRRLAFAPLIAALWRQGPFDVQSLQLATLFWGGLLWLVLLRESARDAHLAPPEEAH